MRVVRPQLQRPLVLLSAVVCLVAGCRDQMPQRTASAVSERDVVAEFAASSLAPRSGDEIVVAVRIRSGAAVGSVASFTARIGYDTTRLRLIGENVLSDGATRMVNPLAGEARVAGISVNGFGDGNVFALRFAALNSDPYRGMLLAFDELHATDGNDLVKTVRTAAQVVPR